MIWRDDDIYLTESPRGYGTYYDLSKFKDTHTILHNAGHIHTLAIVASEIPNYPQLTRYIKARQDQFAFGLHGWNHERYAEWEKPGIKTSLQRAKERIEKTFNTRVEWFFPPWNKRSDAMKEACNELGLKLNDDWMNPSQALLVETHDSICFHYWKDEERIQLKQLCTPLTSTISDPLAPTSSAIPTTN